MTNRHNSSNDLELVIGIRCAILALEADASEATNRNLASAAFSSLSRLITALRLLDARAARWYRFFLMNGRRPARSFPHVPISRQNLFTVLLTTTIGTKALCDQGRSRVDVSSVIELGRKQVLEWNYLKA